MEEEKGCGRLLPGLPDDIALLCLARLPRRALPVARCVSRSWKDAIDHPASLHHVRRTAGISSETWVFVCLTCEPPYQGFLIDPTSLRCDPVPPAPFPPSLVPSPDFYADIDVRGMSAGSYVLLGATSIDIETPLVYCFDSLHRQWLHPPPLPSTLSHLTDFASASAVLHGEGYVYVAGGLSARADGYQALKTAERLAVKSNTGMGEWQTLPDMHLAPMYAVGVMLQDIFYVIGGYQDSPQYSGEYWDPRTGEWVLIRELWPQETFGQEKCQLVTVVAGRLCAVRPLSQDVMVYEPESRQWRFVGSAPIGGPHSYFDHEFHLLGVVAELWVIVERRGSPIFVLACTPAAGKPLVWRRLPFSFDASLIAALTIEV